MTQEELAELTGFSASQLSRWEKGVRPIKSDQLEAIAKALGISTRDLIDDARPVPVVGYVGAGQQVHGIDDHAKGDGLYHVECPEGMDPACTVALEVRGASMAPVADGWLVFYSRAHEHAPQDVLGKVCVVKAADGAYFVKRLRPGYEPGRFNLISTNAEPMENIELEWAAPVAAFLAPENVRRADPPEAMTG